MCGLMQRVERLYDLCGDSLLSSAESSQMSPETPPLPPPKSSDIIPHDNSMTPVAGSPMEEVGHPSTRPFSVMSLGAAISQLGTGKPLNKKDARKSDPLPVPIKPPRLAALPPLPAPPVEETIDETDYPTDDLYDDTLVRPVGQRLFNGTMSNRPAAPLPRENQQVTAVLSLNPLEKLHRSLMGSSEQEQEVRQVRVPELETVDRCSALMQVTIDQDCYSEVDWNDDEEHLYEPTPSGLGGNRLSFSYDDVIDSEEDDLAATQASQYPTQRPGNTMSLQWNELKSDVDAIVGQLDLTSPLPPVPTTDSSEYDRPVDAIDKDTKQQVVRSLKRNTGLLNRVPPPIKARRPKSISTLSNKTTTLQVTNSGSSFHSNEYHLPIDATPVSFTATSRENQPYDVPLECIDFEETYNREYAVPADCPNSGGSSRHSSQKRRTNISLRSTQP